MNLPFTPTFFGKIDIFQQLKEYESQKSEKTLWNGVKAVLVWGASKHHQHLGSSINSNHVKDALNYCVGEKFISEKERNTMVYSCRHILESIPVYGFGQAILTSDPKKPSVKIDRNGMLAGRILIETNFLNDTFWRYGVWVILWWVVLVSALIILLSQTFSTAKSAFFGLNSQTQNNYSFGHYSYPKKIPATIRNSFYYHRPIE